MDEIKKAQATTESELKAATTDAKVVAKEINEATKKMIEASKDAKKPEAAADPVKTAEKESQLKTAEADRDNLQAEKDRV